MIAEYASGAPPSSPQKEYVYAGGSLAIAEIDSGSTVKYYEADTLSVRQVTNSSGGVLGNLGQYPYGESWYQSSSQTEFQFTNYLHDSESDNDYAYAREYVNRLARFETLDPAGGSVSDPLSWDRYTYVLDNPIRNTDPTGLSSKGGGLIWPDWSDPYAMAYWDAPPDAGCTLDGVSVGCGFAGALEGQDDGVVPSLSTTGTVEYEGQQLYYYGGATGPSGYLAAAQIAGGVYECGNTLCGPWSEWQDWLKTTYAARLAAQHNRLSTNSSRDFPTAKTAVGGVVYVRGSHGDFAYTCSDWSVCGPGRHANGVHILCASGGYACQVGSPLVAHDDTWSPYTGKFSFLDIFHWRLWAHGAVDLIWGSIYNRVFAR